MKTNAIFKIAISLYRNSFMYVFILLCLVGFLNSCERNVIPWHENNEKINQIEPATWQEQIKYVQNKNKIATKNYDADKLCLLSYAYKGKIDTEAKRQEVLKSLFADTTMIVCYNDSWHFEILSLKEAKEKSKVKGYDPYIILENQLRTTICTGLEMVDLVWRYKGETYHSTAIVSNEHGGIVYEHIGYRVIDTEEGCFQEDNYLETNFVRTKTSSEGEKRYEARYVICEVVKKYILDFGFGILERG